MFDKLSALWKVSDIRKSILFVLLMIVIYRIAAHIPVPGVDVNALKNYFQSNQVLGLLDIFSGGGIKSFSVVALGVAPYITASIIFQLLTMIIPSFEEMAKEPTGYAKINMWTRWLTVPLAVLQSFALISLLKSQSSQIITNINFTQTLLTVLSVTAGTVLLMWLGELMSEKHIGNGLSIIIFAGIVSSLPGALQRFIATYDPSQLLFVIMFLAVALFTIVSVVFINEGTRNVPVSYARHIRTGGAGPVNTYLPLKVNAAGVIPIIFAVSLLLFPPLIAQFTVQAKAQWLVNISRWVITTSKNQTFYGIAYFVLVFAFTYFYTSIVFRPDQIAENLQKQGGFIPGIRPGEHTKTYLEQVSTRILLAGAIFLGAIAVMPVVIQQITGTNNLIIGGTSILIIVSVVIDMIKQVEAQMTMRDYEI